MPIIYHETEIAILKRTLFDIYNISFNPEKYVQTDVSCNFSIIVQYIEILQDAIDKCNASIKVKKSDKTNVACNSRIIDQCIEILMEAFNKCNNSFNETRTEKSDDKKTDDTCNSKIKKQCIEMLQNTINKYNTSLKSKKTDKTDCLCDPSIENKCIKILLEAFNKCNSNIYAKKLNKTDNEGNANIEAYCIKIMQESIDRCNTNFNAEETDQTNDVCDLCIEDKCIIFLQKAIDKCNAIFYTEKPEQTADVCESIKKDQYIAILQEAIDKCNDVLPADVFNYLETPDSLFKFRADENLLKYVFADAVINLQNDSFCKTNVKERYFTSKRDFFFSFVSPAINEDYKNIKNKNIEDIISQKKNNAYSNFSKLYNIAYNQCWLNDLACFKIPENKKESTEEEKGSPNIYVSKFLPNILGALINKAKNCPYHFYSNNTSADALYTLDAIKKYFKFIYMDEKIYTPKKMQSKKNDSSDNISEKQDEDLKNVRLTYNFTEKDDIKKSASIIFWIPFTIR